MIDRRTFLFGGHSKDARVIRAAIRLHEMPGRATQGLGRR
jgi:hypothetical protein